MTGLRTTASSSAASGACPSDCKEAMNQVMEDVNRIARTRGATERNAAITQAYRQLGQAQRQNHWIRLAGYVSTQGGCVMKMMERGTIGVSFTPLAPLFGEDLVNAQKALVDANTTIFTSVYPPNKFAHDCGFEKLKQCVASGEIEVSPQIMEALEKMDKGDLRGAADTMAYHEQVNVVQPVYERNRGAFEFMNRWENRIPGDQTSIPVSHTCSGDPVSIKGLDIQNPQDRVQYYRRLMTRMRQIEGMPP